MAELHETFRFRNESDAMHSHNNEYGRQSAGRSAKTEQTRTMTKCPTLVRIRSNGPIIDCHRGRVWSIRGGKISRPSSRTINFPPLSCGLPVDHDGLTTKVKRLSHIRPVFGSRDVYHIREQKSCCVVSQARAWHRSWTWLTRASTKTGSPSQGLARRLKRDSPDS